MQSGLFKFHDICHSNILCVGGQACTETIKRAMYMLGTPSQQFSSSCIVFCQLFFQVLSFLAGTMVWFAYSVPWSDLRYPQCIYFTLFSPLPMAYISFIF
jgi:hypothetical protein